jgi:hypothetical protein
MLSLQGSWNSQSAGKMGRLANGQPNGLAPKFYENISTQNISLMTCQPVLSNFFFF